MLFLLLAGALLAGGLDASTTLLLAFDIAAVAFLAMTAHMFSTFSVAKVRLRAKLQDAGRWSVLASSVVLSGVVLVALVVELHAGQGQSLLSIVVAAASILLSWLFTNTMFALHYAHTFYGDHGEKSGGLEFPGTRQPDYWDFAYFAIVIGMTFQVSDVQISGRYLRRMALLHSVVAFFFNVVIIALTVNIVAGKA